MWSDIFSGMGATLAYVGVGAVVLIIGYLVTDWTTPGKLTSLIFDDRNANATIVAASNTTAVSLIVTMAIWTTHEDFGEGIVSTALFGLLGVVLLAIVDRIVDWLTPGDLRAAVNAKKFQPAVVLLAASRISIGFIVAASIA